MTNNCNLGWQFYRNYFIVNHGTNVNLSNKTALESEETEKLFKARNREFENYRIENFYPSLQGTHKFSLQTIYPGLLLGSGYVHEISAKGEMKLGLFFDHTSGLPIIPGSSIKGVLRSAFPGWHFKENEDEKKLKNVKTWWIKCLLTNKPIEESELEFPEGPSLDSLKNEINELEEYIFEGKLKTGSELSTYERDIFFDATIIAAPNALVATDSITPHVKDGMPYEDAMLKNPTPIPFLKVAPGVAFEFNFRLNDGGGISADQKKSLFIQIIKTIGIGAKTNVGYGQFVNPPSLILPNMQGAAITDELVPPSMAARAEINRKLKEAKVAIYTGEIVSSKKENYIIAFEVIVGEIIKIKKKEKAFKNGEPKIGMKVEISMTDPDNCITTLLTN